MEGWHSTGTALFPLLRRVAPASGIVNAKIANLQYPSKWKVHLDSATYALRGDVQPVRAVDISKESEEHYIPKSLKTSRAEKARSKSLLRRLEEIDPSTSKYFKLKQDVQKTFRMRLLTTNSAVKGRRAHDADNAQSMKKGANERASYIALSYCWHYPTWLPNPALSNSSTFSNPENLIPITIPMWKAFLAERRSSTEAFWVDQGCIDQADQDAKIYAINSMDTVFGGARKVVVALEDVLLDPQDAEVLLQYYHTLSSIPKRERLLVWADWLQFLEDKEELAVACLKIFRARWFRRAWCSHEFLTAKSHTFLVPVLNGESPRHESGESVTILSFDNEFLLALLLARTDWIVSKDRKELAGLILRYEAILTGGPVKARSAINRFLGQNAIMVGFTQGLVEATLKRQSSESKKPYLAVLSDVLSLEASSAVDKLVITLNVLKTGLSYHGPPDLSETDVSLLGTMIALASGDASALASSGPFLTIKDFSSLKFSTCSDKSRGQQELATSQTVKLSDSVQRRRWATKPYIDTYSRLGFERIESRAGNLSMTQDGLQLNMRFVATSSCIRAPSPCFEAFAQTLLSWYPRQASYSGSSSDLSPGEDAVLAEFRAFSLEKDQVHQTLTGIDLPYLTQVLACLLELGLWWLAGYGRHLKAHVLNTDTDQTDDPMETVQEALRWAQCLPSHPRNLGSRDKDSAVIEPKINHLTSLILYASEVVKTGAGERSEFVKKQISPDFSFRICKIHDAANDMPSSVETLVFAPSSKISQYELAIPTPLTISGYPVDMNRVWILEKMAIDVGNDLPSQERMCEKYTIRGKTRFVGCTIPDGEERRVIVGG